jgi:hypothetical protein
MEAELSRKRVEEGRGKWIEISKFLEENMQELSKGFLASC